MKAGSMDERFPRQSVGNVKKKKPGKFVKLRHQITACPRSVVQSAIVFDLANKHSIFIIITLQQERLALKGDYCPQGCETQTG